VKSLLVNVSNLNLLVLWLVSKKKQIMETGEGTVVALKRLQLTTHELKKEIGILQ
jgi:competence protein ComGC